MSRKTYKDFPKEYFAIIERFGREHGELSLDMTAREAQTQRRTIYRFAEKLEIAAELGDKEAKRLFKIYRDLKISIRPTGARGDEPASLVVVYDKLKLRMETIFSGLS